MFELNPLTCCQGKMSAWGIAYQQHEFVFYLNFYLIACLVSSIIFNYDYKQSKYLPKLIRCSWIGQNLIENMIKSFGSQWTGES